MFPRPAPRAIIEGHLERDRESLAGLSLRGGLEENFDLMYF